MFILSPIPKSLEFWSVNHTSIYKNSELKDFLKIKFWGEISNNWQNVGNKFLQDSWILLIIMVDNIAKN